MIKQASCFSNQLKISLSKQWKEQIGKHICKYFLLIFLFGCSHPPIEKEQEKIIEQKQKKESKFHFDEVMENLVISKKYPHIEKCAKKRAEAMSKLGLKIDAIGMRELKRACIYLTKHFSFDRTGKGDFSSPRDEPIKDENYYRQQQLRKSGGK